MTPFAIYHLRLYYFSNYIFYIYFDVYGRGVLQIGLPVRSMPPTKVVLCISYGGGENIGSIFRKYEVAELAETRLSAAPILEQPD